MEDLDRKQYVENLNKAESDEEKKRITAEFEAQEMRLRRRSLGNIRFIGELYKIKIITGKIMHECIRKLLLQTDEESLECLCRLVTTVGQVRDRSVLSKDHPKIHFVSAFGTRDQGEAGNGKQHLQFRRLF